VRNRPITIEQMIIWGLLAIGSIMLNGGSVVGDNPPASRWARVDLTQYCGKTIGELIDALGNDYVKYETIREHHFLNSFYFVYSDKGFPNVAIVIHPAKLQYCDYDLNKGEPKMEDIRRERIYLITLRTGRGR